MKPIKIADTNSQKINTLLDQVNGRAKSFTLTSRQEVSRLVEMVEKQLSTLPKKQWNGVSVRYKPAGPSKSYKYKAKTTAVEITRKATGWFLSDVTTDIVYPGETEVLRINITNDQAEALKAAAVAKFNVEAE